MAIPTSTHQLRHIGGPHIIAHGPWTSMGKSIMAGQIPRRKITRGGHLHIHLAWMRPNELVGGKSVVCAIDGDVARIRKVALHHRPGEVCSWRSGAGNVDEGSLWRGMAAQAKVNGKRNDWRGSVDIHRGGTGVPRATSIKPLRPLARSHGPRSRWITFLTSPFSVSLTPEVDWAMFAQLFRGRSEERTPSVSRCGRIHLPEMIP